MWSATWQLRDLCKAAGCLVCRRACALAHALHRSLPRAQGCSRCWGELAACGEAWHTAGRCQVPLALYETRLMALL